MFDASDDCSSVTREVDADVVLLVVDAASVIGREDLLLLDDAAESGIPVVVALTRIDVYRDWQAVRRRDARFSLRTAPLLLRPRWSRLRPVKSSHSLRS